MPEGYRERQIPTVPRRSEGSGVGQRDGAQVSLMRWTVRTVRQMAVKNLRRLFQFGGGVYDCTIE